MAKMALDHRGLREKLGINQREFWTTVGVTQSGGSRYENGRIVPTPVAMLLTLAYGNKLDAQRLLNRMRKSR